MCHHELWPASVSHPSSLLNSSLGLVRRKFARKYYLHLGTCLPKLCCSRLLSFLLLFTFFWLGCHCSTRIAVCHSLTHCHIMYNIQTLIFVCQGMAYAWIRFVWFYTILHNNQDYLMFSLRYWTTSVIKHALTHWGWDKNGRHFSDDIFKCIFLDKDMWFPLKISLMFVTRGLINNIPALVQAMAWWRPGDKPLSEPMMVSLPTHICVTRPQWVKQFSNKDSWINNNIVKLIIRWACKQHRQLSNVCPVSTNAPSSWICLFPCVIDRTSVMGPKITWWRHQMETFYALLTICAGNSPVPGEFPAQRPVTRSFDVFFDLRLNKRLSKQSWGWWFETPSRPLWRHCNVACSSGLLILLWEPTFCYYMAKIQNTDTVKCWYNAVDIAITVAESESDIRITTDTHITPSWASYGVCIVRILENIHRDITAPRCMKLRRYIIFLSLYIIVKGMSTQTHVSSLHISSTLCRDHLLHNL